LKDRFRLRLRKAFNQKTTIIAQIRSDAKKFKDIWKFGFDNNLILLGVLRVSAGDCFSQV
jgi:hypothetical protein